jgi:hypothetical protein
MKIEVLLEAWQSMRCAATLMVLVLMAPLVEVANAAQQNNSSKETQDKTEKTEPKKATLRIEVLVMDPESKQSPQHVEDATVKIAGEEESYATGQDGKTQSFTVLPGVKTAVIHASGATCSVDITVKEGRQDMKVLVEKLPQAKCTLQP